MEPDTEQSAGFSLQDYLAILRRRRAIIIQAFILITVIGVAQALIAKNTYQASTRRPTRRSKATCPGQRLVCAALALHYLDFPLHGLDFYLCCLAF